MATDDKSQNVQSAMTSLDPPLLTIRGVSKMFGDFEALRNVSLDVRQGEVVCVVGPSGAGKSTLLRCINALEELDIGEIKLSGELLAYRPHRGHLVKIKSRALAKQRRHFGMVFQSFNLFPHRTALENVMEGPVRVLGKKPMAAEKEARRLLESVGLGLKAGSYPRELSGGQQQRVAIARALAMSPSVMLFDEPTSALDAELVGEVLEVMRGLAAKGMTMIVVTHEIQFARDVGDTMIFMVDGEIIERGTPEQVMHRSTNERARSFFSAVSQKA